MARFKLMTSELSPFSLKIQSCLSYVGHEHKSLPAQGSKFENSWQAIKVEIAKRRGTIYKYPKMTELDEYPGVPFLIEPGGRVQYDSSAISRWLDTQHNPRKNNKLWPQDPNLAFIAQLIDEAMDDFAINVVHHMRWWHCAASNTAGKRLFKEFSKFPLFAMKKGFPTWFSKRQVRRLPYLLSMPPQDYKQDVADYLKAPLKEGWPQTHELLDQCWNDYILALENVLTKQPYLLGGSFTIADASVFGMFGMLLDDPEADQEMFKRTPVLHSWLIKIKNNQHLNNINNEKLKLSEDLKPLISIILNTFVPLMKQNEAAYLLHKSQGETLFNETAWRKDRALYTGDIMGHPFKSVCKTFTVQVWRDILKNWHDLGIENSLTLMSYLPQFREFKGKRFSINNPATVSVAATSSRPAA